MSTEAILNENEERRLALSAPYDPLKGTGSPIEREEMVLSERHGSVFVPAQMFNNPKVAAAAEAGGVEMFAREQGADPSDVLQDFHRLRLKADYEFFCATCVTIEDKEGRLVPLVMNRPQRKSLAVRERQRAATKDSPSQPIRQVELKHRQYGSTTEKNSYLCWLQNVLYERRHAYVISLVKGGAAKIMRRYEIIAEHYPQDVGAITLRNVRNAPSSRLIAERGAMLSIASVNRPQAPSGDTVQFVLVSEAGKMKSTEVQSAERLITNLQSMVPMKAGTAFLVESTAEQSGAWFRREVQKAKKGESQFAFTFISWLDDAALQVPITDLNAPEWIEGWGDYLRFLWSEGATLEQIRWYELKRRGYPHAWEMMQENPSTDIEAFQSSGTRYFSARAVSEQRERYMQAPALIGELRGEAREGERAFEELRFVERENGALKLWRRPDDDYGGLVKPNMRYVNRFCGFADFGGKTENADWSVLTVIDRFMMLYGGLPEVAARLRLHMRPDIFAWQSAQLCWWYGGESGFPALLAYETNRHKKDRGDDVRGYEPEWSLAVLEEVAGVYPNLYLRTNQERIDVPESKRIGFHTTRGGKEMILNVLDQALEEDRFVERDQVAFQEFDFYEKKPDGRLGAVEGENDDIVISTAGALWLALKYLGPVREVPLKKDRGRAERRSRPLAASF